MTEATLILQRFRDRLKQIHMSEVNSLSRHERITFTALNSFRKVAHLIPADVPVILETPVQADHIRDQVHDQIQLAEQVLSPTDTDTPPPRALNGLAKASPFPLEEDPVTK
jgi:hypothetical protein